MKLIMVIEYPKIITTIAHINSVIPTMNVGTSAVLKVLLMKSFSLKIGVQHTCTHIHTHTINPKDEGNKFL